MPTKILPSTINAPQFVAGSPLPIYYQVVSKTIREIYFSNVSPAYHNRNSSKNIHPKLIICSHRNSAFDAYIALKEFPKAQALASIQLLNSRLMRAFFTGIPVVRKKDRARFGINSNAFSSPSEAAVEHIKAGGDLLLFPEGSSEWGCKPLPYQRGAARIIRSLLDEGIVFDIIPVGLFYLAPDKFSSEVELYIGDNIIIPQQGDLTSREWEQNIHQDISLALNNISVNCPDIGLFKKASSYACNRKIKGDSYAESFIDYQNNLIKYEESNRNIENNIPHSIKTWRYISFCFMFIFFPILLSALIASRFADARNTVSFFKIIGGSLAAIIWLPILFILLFFSPLFISVSLISALIGLKIIRTKGSQIC